MNPGPRVVDVVCRANQGRSPLVAYVLSTHAAQITAETGEPIVVRSAGVNASVGLPALPLIQAELQQRGIDLSEHRTQPWDSLLEDEAGAPDLVVTFEAALTAAILDRRPELVGRVFTLREIVRLANSEGWDEAWNGSDDVVNRLTRMRPWVDQGEDDSPDPVRLHEASEAEQAVSALLGDGGRVGVVLWG